MKGKKGLMGSIMGIIYTLSLIGLFLAILSQFGGNLSDMFQWILNTAWAFIITIRNTILGWNVFQGLF